MRKSGTRSPCLCVVCAVLGDEWRADIHDRACDPTCSHKGIAFHAPFDWQRSSTSATESSPRSSRASWPHGNVERPPHHRPTRIELFIGHIMPRRCCIVVADLAGIVRRSSGGGCEKSELYTLNQPRVLHTTYTPNYMSLIYDSFVLNLWGIHTGFLHFTIPFFDGTILIYLFICRIGNLLKVSNSFCTFAVPFAILIWLGDFSWVICYLDRTKITQSMWVIHGVVGIYFIGSLLIDLHLV
jgi:hypothetical protein